MTELCDPGPGIPRDVTDKQARADTQKETHNYLKDTLVTALLSTEHGSM